MTTFNENNQLKKQKAKRKGRRKKSEKYKKKKKQTNKENTLTESDYEKSKNSLLIQKHKKVHTYRQTKYSLFVLFYFSKKREYL